MTNPFEEPFAKPRQRKPGVAGLVGEVFGEKAEAAYVKRVSEGRNQPSILVLQEDWGGGDMKMSAAEREKMQIEKDHVRLHDIPTFTELPDEDTLKKDFGFDRIWEREYRQDRPVSDFALTDADLIHIRLNEQTRARIMEAMSKANEPHPLAKVFDIGDIIRQKRQADPHHRADLSTREVFEAIDAAGYRPATLQELLAYGRDCWKPDVDPDSLLDEEEKRFQFANAREVFALGSSFSNSRGVLSVPGVYWYESKRELTGAESLADEWGPGSRFLVIPKVS